jgi:hypothetical protein
MTATTQRLTFAELAALEPELIRLDSHAQAVAQGERKKGRRCCGTRGFFVLARWLERLVGMWRPDGHPVLSSFDACKVVEDRIYALMPDCRHAGSCP